MAGGVSHSGPAACGVPAGGRVLLTGAAGFVGGYLARELADAGYVVLTTDAVDAPQLANFRRANICDRAEMDALFADLRPDACVHLGAISFVPDGASDPGKMLSVNIGGTVNIVDAILRESPSTKLLFISTSQVYGGPTGAEGVANAPIDEGTETRPLTMYSISKAAAERAIIARVATNGLNAVIARPANHTGPRQSPRFVAPSFAAGLARIARGESSEIRVGNLDSVRDFTDVRDVVKAYRMLLEKGAAGEAYNISSGTHISIGELLRKMMEMSGVDAPVVRDPALCRPADASRALSTEKIRAATGWAPTLALDDIIRDILAEYGLARK